MADPILHKQEGSIPETENGDEATLTSKRKLDSLSIPQAKEVVEEDRPKKSQKLQSLTENGNSPVHEEKSAANGPLLYSANNSGSNSEEKNTSEAKAEDNDVVVEEEDEDDADYDDDGDDDEDMEEENGEVGQVDRKGKGIMIEKGEDGSDDDSSDDGSELDGDGSELEDDPLAEVDLDNILPSRTRRRAAQPGVYIANDLGNDDDDSDA
ncbi:hypothetical protein JCGZ_26853 [Jatropha curcas]|uniref:Histone chaperone domain-containing protein n=1 Tax=Jatropha curcas TaxID=180498 RepID=A0A067LBG4_JATCU|nr:hypothetical protein JCGZ_26853 [Jatropha curcas]